MPHRSNFARARKESKKVITDDKVLRILKELSTEKFDSGHVTKGDPNYSMTLKRDLNHYGDILKLFAHHTNMGRCLEIGIGYAYLAVLIRRLLNYEVIGVEQKHRNYVNNTLWKSLLEKEDITFKICDVTREPLCFESESFDLVSCCEVVEHLPVSPRKMLDETHRVLKNNGTLILTTPNFASLPNRFKLLLGRNLTQPLGDEPPEDAYSRHWREYVPEELVGILKQSKFSIERLHLSDCWDRTSRKPYLRYLPKFIPSVRSDIMIVAKKRASQSLRQIQRYTVVTTRSQPTLRGRFASLAFQNFRRVSNLSNGNA